MGVGPLLWERHRCRARLNTAAALIFKCPEMAALFDHRLLQASRTVMAVRQRSIARHCLSRETSVCAQFDHVCTCPAWGERSCADLCACMDGRAMTDGHGALSLRSSKNRRIAHARAGARIFNFCQKLLSILARRRQTSGPLAA